jgi:hypothetical protein
MRANAADFGNTVIPSPEPMLLSTYVNKESKRNGISRKQ